eukprot:gene27527-33250_t
MIANDPLPSSESVKVLVRVRPLNNKEQLDINNAELAVAITSSNSLSVTSIDQKKSFQCSYDAVLGPYATQSQVYDKVKECTMAVMNGINATIFAYGQTGSGKTHSMYGPPNYINAHARETDQLGVIPRAINHIFELSKSAAIQDFTVHCSFVQLYNENLYDMLRDPGMHVPLTIREDNKEIYVQGLSEYSVHSVTDTLQLLKIAEDNRAIRETHMNMFSSRSHSIFQIFVEFKKMAEEEEMGEVHYKAKFNLVDLAGSEKWDIRRDLRDEHIAEMTNINLSLHTLGKCISSLAKISRRKQKQLNNSSIDLNASYNELDSRSVSSLDGLNTSMNMSLSRSKPSTANMHVPFRESKLTRLLQDSLGGTAKTFLIATVSPARTNSEESISTLKFADRAKQVMVQAVVNESRPVDYAVVKKLQTEVEALKALLRRVVGVGSKDSLVGLLNSGGSEGLTEHERLYLQKALDDCQGSFGHSFDHASTAQSPVKQRSSKPPAYNHEDAENFDTASANAASGGANKAEQGTTLEYVISLEKALNKEQVHAQHLTKKNETLIKELEELKMTNMQLAYAKDRGGSSSSAAPVPAAIGVGVGAEVFGQMKFMMQNVQTVLKQSEDMLLQTDNIQKIVKKFFKFQLEEEDMKAQLTKIFDSLKTYKQQETMLKLQEMWQTLEKNMSTVVNQNTSTASNATESGDDDNDDFYSAGQRSEHNVGHHSQVTPKHRGGGSQSHSKIANTSPSEHMNSHGGSSASSMSKRNVKSQARSLPQLQQVEDNTIHQDHKRQKEAHSQHHSHGHLQQDSSGANGDIFAISSSSSSQHVKKSIRQPSPLVLQDDPPPSQAISFRVRGGPSSNVSEGWIAPNASAMPVEDEEERIRQELKLAKKKQKQQERLAQWAKEKEDKAMQELRAQEEEKRAMKEAELMREAKRKEYAEKQKSKLAAYQDRVKTETEKIQELIKLGIDPKSLNL